MTKKEIIKKILKFDGCGVRWDIVERETKIKINQYYYGDTFIDGTYESLCSGLGRENNYRLLKNFTKKVLESILNNIIKDDNHA